MVEELYVRLGPATRSRTCYLPRRVTACPNQCRLDSESPQQTKEPAEGIDIVSAFAGVVPPGVPVAQEHPLAGVLQRQDRTSITACRGSPLARSMVGTIPWMGVCTPWRRHRRARREV
eukprot:scaffold844_cov602-Prasinococcus_capsulatus_cf.AAC.2